MKSARWATAWVVAILVGPGAVRAQEPPPADEVPPEAEEPAQPEAPVVEEQITVTGTRVEGRTVTDSVAPVSYIDSLAIESVGSTETGKILQLLEPSANFSTTFISDGTDSIRPATLRSLGPDQTLVLVNGKRRHQTGLIHYQQTVGRGSAGFDLNSIPAAAIHHIEVLRDGAAAQYGSDAIAGVVNIILKEQTGETDIGLDSGQTYEGDGGVLNASVNHGFKLGERGFLNLTAEYRDREETNRAGPDSLRVSPPSVTQRIGDSDAKDAYLWLNAVVPTGDNEIYAFGGYSERETNSSGFFRSAGDGRTVPDLYPNGFLPTIVTEPSDAALVAGMRGHMSENWHWDASLNWGMNEFRFREENTVNVSWWYEPLDPSDPTGPRFNASPTAADTGTLTYDQLVANLDFMGELDWGVGAGPLNLAFGAEWRNEGYEIEPGEPVSYTYGRADDRGVLIFNQGGGIAAAGTQGFPGFQDAVDEERDSIAAYVDLESRLASKFLAGFALRFEDFSDFGSTLTGKLSGRIDFSDRLALRSTVSTGFRAPGVQQSFFTLRSTNLNAAGVLTDTLTAANNSPVARALGIPSLEEETSRNYSLGLVARPTSRFRLTVDVYRIDIDDRIIFSDAISSDVPAVGAILNPLGIGQVQFFTNAVDTQTDGLDIVAVYDLSIGRSLLSLEAALSFNDTEVTERRSASAIIPVDLLFPASQVTLVEEGQPGEHYVVGATLHHGDFSTNLRFNYFGSVAAEWFTQPYKQTWGGKWLTDLSFSYRLTDSMTLSVGGLNVFDEYPDEWDRERAAPFPQLGFVYGWETVPFGINGGSYYARLGYRIGGS
jgi:iron complex outermembrane receptor protein